MGDSPSACVLHSLDTASGRWAKAVARKGGQGPCPRRDAAVWADASVGKGKGCIDVFGGSVDHPSGSELDPVIVSLGDMWRFDVAAAAWHELPGSGGGNAPCPRTEAATAALPGGGCALFGGYSTTLPSMYSGGWSLFAFLGDAFVYSPQSGWRMLRLDPDGLRPDWRCIAAAVVEPRSGRLLLWGGGTGFGADGPTAATTFTDLWELSIDGLAPAPAAEAEAAASPAAAAVDAEPPEGLCALPGCGATRRPSGRKLHVCSKCMEARYCTPEHATEHWPAHKAWCKTTQEERQAEEAKKAARAALPPLPEAAAEAAKAVLEAAAAAGDGAGVAQALSAAGCGLRVGTGGSAQGSATASAGRSATVAAKVLIAAAARLEAARESTVACVQRLADGLDEGNEDLESFFAQMSTLCAAPALRVRLRADTNGPPGGEGKHPPHCPQVQGCMC